MSARPTVAVCGMTHLGVVTAAALAEAGHRVIGLDLDPAAVDRLRRGELPIYEPGLPEMVAAGQGRLGYTANPADIARAEVVYVAPDVPTGDDGRSDLGPLRALLDTVMPAVGPSAVLVVLSQVPPGFTRRLPFAPERLYYQVETLVIGRAVERAQKPERYIVGCADPSRALPTAFDTVLRGPGCPVLAMRYESAELAKIAINCMLATSVGMTNTLAGLAERIGADWAEIEPALRLDRRIGAHAYITPGMGIVGGNIERDLVSVLDTSQRVGVDAGVIAAIRRNSSFRRDWVLGVLHRTVLAGTVAPCLGVLGLAYKENTRWTKNSAAVDLLNWLRPFAVAVHDPEADPADCPHGRWVADPLAAADGADALCVMTAWPQYRKLDLGALAARMRGRVLIDPYGLFTDAAARVAGMRHYRLGLGEEAAPC